MDFAKAPIDPYGGFGCLSSVGPGSPLQEMYLAAVATTTLAGAWPSANEALFYPVLVREPVSVYGFGWSNGASVSGNVDAGIYDTHGTRLASLGSTAMSGTSALQSAALGGPQAIDPGLYYLGMAADNTTATFMRVSTVHLEYLRASGVQKMASAFALPSTATYAAMDQGYTPLVFAYIESSTF